jgi:2,4-dienoyl-CoA reductase (NADPH2)
VLSYIDVLRHKKPVGQRVASSVRVASGLTWPSFCTSTGGHSTTTDLPAWQAEWGVTDPALAPGGLATCGPGGQPARTAGDAAAAQGRQARRRPGQDHGLDSPHALKMKQVKMVGGVNYERIGDEGLLVTYGEKRGTPRGLPATPWCCARARCRCANWPMRCRRRAKNLDTNVHVIGGALEAGELDAKRAIDQAARLAATL